MKRLIVFVMFLSLISTEIMAQSSMTDSQVADFVQKEAAKGTSQSQIVTRLMQNGVDISQIRRVRKMYDRQKQNLGLGSDEQADRTSSRLRTNNGKKTEEEAEADKKATAAKKSQNFRCSRLRDTSGMSSATSFGSPKRRTARRRSMRV